MKNKKNILLIGQTPPPYHGQAVATKQLFDHEWNTDQIYFLRMNYSSLESQVGRFSVRKVFHLFGLIIKSLVILIRRYPCALYYLPASPNLVPVLRDIFFLLIVRPFSRGTIFHYHAGGLPKYVKTSRFPVRLLANLALAKPNLGIEVSNSQLRESNYFSSERRVVIPNGLDVPVEKFKREKLEAVQKRILFIAGLRKSKGVLDVIETALKIKQKESNFIIDIAGSWQEPETEKLFQHEISKHNLEDHIMLHGRVAGDDKWKLYSSADIFFFPSYYESENFPLVLIEAMAFGLPIVSTKWRGIPEMVENDHSGILCEVGKCDEFSQALYSLIIDQSLHEKMSAKARGLYLKKYTQRIFLDSMEKAFDSVTLKN